MSKNSHSPCVLLAGVLLDVAQRGVDFVRPARVAAHRLAGCVGVVGLAPAIDPRGDPGFGEVGTISSPSLCRGTASTGCLPAAISAAATISRHARVLPRPTSTLIAHAPAAAVRSVGHPSAAQRWSHGRAT